ncbi:MAG: FHA domain-containing protein [Gemmataceae bacterium]
MIKCPFCHYENEDGALFCERCTSDLSAVAPTPAPLSPPPIPPALPAIPVAEAMPLVAEAVPFEASPFEAIPVAMAEPIDAFPLTPIAEAEPIELAPVMPAALEHIPSAPPVPAVEPVPMAAPVAPPPPPAPAPAPDVGAMPATAQPRLLVQRGQRRNVEYPIYEGANFIGRADEKPVDIDLEDQEPPDRIWCSRQHACLMWENDVLTLEDLNSANGTYVNRARVYPGQKKQLVANDIIQIGNVQLKVVI